ncbi:MAG TPA: helix-hairpin-helix domain-containing protein [Planctomycetota bacterium]|nr:helix-hairpin-helix domain-containing protein [Planctomycetota bacterium]
MSSEKKGIKRFWLFSPSEAVILLIVLATLLSAVTVRILQRTRPAGQGMTVATGNQDFRHRINLNTATQQELLLVPGIGTARAQKIIEYRRKQGRFEMVDDLARVDGFTRKLAAQLAQYLYVDPQDRSEAR